MEIASPTWTGDNKSLIKGATRSDQVIISLVAPRATEGPTGDNKSNHGINTHTYG